jgi:N-acetylneuraminic acid mutarotase
MGGTNVKRVAAVVVGLVIVMAVITSCSSGGGGSSSATTTRPAADLAAYQWRTVLDGAPWGPRAGLRVVDLDGTLFVMGGRTPKNSPIPGDSDLWGDVWQSDDGGASWSQVSQTGQSWPARAYFQAVTLDGSMYVLGGQNFAFPSSTFFNDVWRSSDGKSWQELTPAAPWAGRAGLMAAAFDGALYVFGGSRNDDTAVVGPTGPTREYFNDVWRSTDGVTWEQLTAAAPWSPRAGSAVVVKDGELYLLGGETGFVCSPQPGCTPPYYNDVWKTKDGVTWEQVTAAAAWSPRPGHQCELLAPDIVCFGGFGQPTNPLDMWASEDGANWRKLDQTPWGATSADQVRYDFDSVVTTDGSSGLPAILTVGGDRETFDFTDTQNYTRVDDDVWTFAPPSGTG